MSLSIFKIMRTLIDNHSTYRLWSQYTVYRIFSLFEELLEHKESKLKKNYKQAGVHYVYLFQDICLKTIQDYHKKIINY